MQAFPRAELIRLTERTSYPTIDRYEWRALREYLRRHGAEYDELRFDVRIGIGVKLEGEYSDKFKADWERRTKMKPDCIGFIVPDRATIIETKVQWTNGAVWQILSYRDHYQIDFPGHTVATIGVCESATPSALALSTARGIVLYRYEFPANDPLAPGAELGAS